MANWKRIALRLVGATLAYNVIEAVVAIWAGEVADSVALVAFGLDSVIESAAAVVMLRHLVLEARGASPEDLEASEHRTHRFIGFTFFALAAYVAFEAGRTLWVGDAPAASPAGIVLAVLSSVESVFPPVPADVAVVFGAFLSRRGVTSAPLLGVVCWLANTASSAGMYFLARARGRRFFAKGWPSKLLTPDAIEALERVYRKHGVAGIFVSRFLPGLRAAVTPFVLERIGAATEGRSVPANLSLAENNARVAVEIAAAIVA